MQALKRCLGVDLGTNMVKVVELAVEGGAISVVRAASAETGIEPTTSPEDRRAAISRTVRELIKKNKFSTKNAVFGLSGLKVFIRRFRFPKTNEERLNRMVQYEARQQIPFPLDKTELQFQFFPTADGMEVDVLLVAVRIDEIKDFMMLVDKSGLTPVAIGVSSFALFNAHTMMRMRPEDLAARNATKKPAGKKGGFALPFGKKKAAAEEPAPAEAEGEAVSTEEYVPEEVKGFVNLGATSYDIAIARLGKSSSLGFVRTPPIGGNDMTRAIMESCKVSSFTDAERIKRSATRLMTLDFGFDEGGEVNEDACMAATNSAERIISELRRSLDFYISQPDGMAVDAIEISGGLAMLSGFESLIEEKLTIPCSVLKAPPETSAVKWTDDAGPIAPYLPAVGLASQGLSFGSITVDFLPSERKIIRDFPYRSTAVMVAIVLATAGVSTQAGSDYSKKLEREALAIRSTLERSQGDIKRQDDAQKRHSDVAAEFARVSQALTQRDYWIQLKARLASKKPADVTITELDLGHSGEVRIKGLSETMSSAALFTTELASIFPNTSKAPEIVRLNPIRPRGFEKDISEFEIVFTMNDKQNTMNVYPTPAPTPVGGPGAQLNPQLNPQLDNSPQGF